MGNSFEDDSATDGVTPTAATLRLPTPTSMPRVKLYDLRLVQRGSIQSYEGHVNSHTRIQIGVDPFEKFLMSEDCNLRLWSIKSGELLVVDKFSSSVPSTVCWRIAENERQCFQEYPQTESYEFGA